MYDCGVMVLMGVGPRNGTGPRGNPEPGPDGNGRAEYGAVGELESYREAECGSSSV